MTIAEAVSSSTQRCVLYVESGVSGVIVTLNPVVQLDVAVRLDVAIHLDVHVVSRPHCRALQLREGTLPCVRIASCIVCCA